MKGENHELGNTHGKTRGSRACRKTYKYDRKKRDTIISRTHNTEDKYHGTTYENCCLFSNYKINLLWKVK